jgi:hypothetical protein
LSPQRLCSSRRATAAAAHFWGYRQNKNLDELLVEASLYTYISRWRKAYIAARYEREPLIESCAAPDDQPPLLCQVVENISDAPSLLAEMAKDDDATVRIAVAENIFTDLKTILNLAEDLIWRKIEIRTSALPSQKTTMRRSLPCNS